MAAQVHSDLVAVHVLAALRVDIQQDGVGVVDGSDTALHQNAIGSGQSDSGFGRSLKLGDQAGHVGGKGQVHGDGAVVGVGIVDNTVDTVDGEGLKVSVVASVLPGQVEGPVGVRSTGRSQTVLSTHFKSSHILPIILNSDGMIVVTFKVEIISIGNGRTLIKLTITTIQSKRSRILADFPIDRNIRIIGSAPGQHTGDGVVALVHSQLGVANGEGQQVVISRVLLGSDGNSVHSALLHALFGRNPVFIVAITASYFRIAYQNLTGNFLRQHYHSVNFVIPGTIPVIRINRLAIDSGITVVIV